MAANRRPRVFLDGYNLALDQGTGVATYARNLSLAMGQLGCEVGVLYGTRAAPGPDPLIREIAFFDERVGKPPRWLVALRRTRRMLFAPLGERAMRVPITGQVIATPFRDRLPHFDEIWTPRTCSSRPMPGSGSPGRNCGSASRSRRS